MTRVMRRLTPEMTRSTHIGRIRPKLFKKQTNAELVNKNGALLVHENILLQLISQPPCAPLTKYAVQYIPHIPTILVYVLVSFINV